MAQHTHTVLIAGGGTGGHVFPAMAVAQELEALDQNIKVVFVGTERGMEARVLPKAGYTLETLDVLHLKGGGVAGWTRGLSKFPKAAAQALGVLWKHRPSLVVSVGGYAAGPITMLASLLGIPTVLMEQNTLPGMTNRILSRVVRQCFVSFEETCDILAHASCVVTGNPVRASFLEATRAAAPAQASADGGDVFRILITGGSGGAGALNAALPGVLRSLSPDVVRRLEVIHQAGRGRAAQVVDDYRGFGGSVEVVEFIDDMAGAYAWADLAVCRAGATTLAELLVLGQPAMLIPFAGAADDHQARNAQSATEAGAAVMVREEELGSGRAVRLLEGLVRNREVLESMRTKSKSLGRPEAGREIAKRIAAMLEGS